MHFTPKAPNTALRFRPPGSGEDKSSSPLAPGVAAQAASGASAGRLWLPDETGKPKSVQVRLGLTDGSMTEILSNELREGTAVLVGIAAAAKTSAAPVGPRFP